MKNFYVFVVLLLHSIVNVISLQMKLLPNQKSSTTIPKSSYDISKQSLRNYNQFISKILISSIPIIGNSMMTSKANAKTYFDITVYGDKELKIATVNKLKQKLRNAILQDISLAPDFMKLAINDALGYDVNTFDGGSDGSILFEMDRNSNKGLQKALDMINTIKKDLLRTNVVTLSDVVAFAGCEALEAVGCDRIAVQVGRFDSPKENKKVKVIPWNNLNDIKEVKEAFSSSGLDLKDIVVLFGGLGEMQRIVKETNEKLLKEKKDADDDDEPLDEEPFVPVTFGTRDAIYGAKVGAGDFGSKFFINILKSNKDDEIGKILLADPDIKSLVVKYSTNQRAFVQDLAESYVKLTTVGKEFTNRNS